MAVVRPRSTGALAMTPTSGWDYSEVNSQMRCRRDSLGGFSTDSCDFVAQKKEHQKKSLPHLVYLFEGGGRGWWWWWWRWWWFSFPFGLLLQCYWQCVLSKEGREKGTGDLAALRAYFLYLAKACMNATPRRQLPYGSKSQSLQDLQI